MLPDCVVPQITIKIMLYYGKAVKLCVLPVFFYCVCIANTFKKNLKFSLFFSHFFLLD